MILDSAMSDQIKNIGNSQWETYCFFPHQERDQLPTHAGVYAVYFDGDLVYIGSSSNVRNRFSGHAFRYSYGKTIITPWQEIPQSTRIDIKVKKSVARGDWLMWEARLIYKLLPIFNKKLTGRGRK